MFELNFLQRFRQSGCIIITAKQIYLYKKQAIRAKGFEDVQQNQAFAVWRNIARWYVYCCKTSIV
jgi:hypothetical protein